MSAYRCEAGEIFDEIDCLQLVVRRPEDELGDEAVVLGDFDMIALFKAAFETEGVPEPFRETGMMQRHTLPLVAPKTQPCHSRRHAGA